MEYIKQQAIFLEQDVPREIVNNYNNVSKKKNND